MAQKKTEPRSLLLPTDAWRLKKAIRRLVRAEVNRAFAGASHPDDRPKIQTEARRALQHAKKLIAKLEGKEV